MDELEKLKEVYSRYETESPRNPETGPWLDAMWRCDQLKLAIKGAIDDVDHPVLLAKIVSGLHGATMALAYKAGAGELLPEGLNAMFGKLVEEEEDTRAILGKWGRLIPSIGSPANMMAHCCGIIHNDCDRRDKQNMVTTSLATSFAVFFEIGREDCRTAVKQ
jgi:hypothetical protein